jgi:alpha-beta hydrolase superfamily lysophospholipase
VLKARGIRFITIDRPGNGGTDEVPLAQRIDTYTGVVRIALSDWEII